MSVEVALCDGNLTIVGAQVMTEGTPRLDEPVSIELCLQYSETCHDQCVSIDQAASL